MSASSSRSRLNAFRANVVIWLSKPHTSPHKIRSVQRRPKVAEDPSHVGASKHHAAVIYRIVPVHSGAVDLKWDISRRTDRSRADADDVSLDLFTLQCAHRFVKGLNGICNRDFTGASGERGRRRGRRGAAAMADGVE